MAKPQRLRVGVVGLGRRGQQHMKTISGLSEHYQLVAICDLSETVAAANAQRLGLKGYSDLNKFFSSENLDVVVITTPRETHHLVVNVAAGYGVHMLIETPLAPTRAMMDAIQEAVAKAGRQGRGGREHVAAPHRTLEPQGDRCRAYRQGSARVQLL